MGYPVPSNSPKITIAGRTICVAAFEWSNPVGSFFRIGVYEQQLDGSWNQYQMAAEYANAGDLILDMQTKGGSVKYLAWLCAAINKILASMFGATAPPDAGFEPTTDAEAKAFVSASIAGMSLGGANGIPVLR